MRTPLWQRGTPATPARMGNLFPREVIYTTTGRVGFLVSETAYTVTIQLGPDTTLTFSKEDIDHRARVA